MSNIKVSTGAMAAWLCTGSFQDIFVNGVMEIFTGVQPLNADAVETGDKVAIVTVDGGAFTAGVATNGLNFDDTTDATLTQASAEDWKGAFIVEGTMGWFRFYANDQTAGASTTAIRFDGSVGTSTRADAQVVTTDATIGGSVDFSNFKLNFSIV